jgi:hypothetical protein
VAEFDRGRVVLCHVWVPECNSVTIETAFEDLACSETGWRFEIFDFQISNLKLDCSGVQLHCAGTGDPEYNSGTILNGHNE